DALLLTLLVGGLLLAGLLLTGDGPLRTLPGPGVGAGPLAAHRKVPAVPDPLVGADLDLPADVGGDLPAKVTLHPIVALQVVTQLDELLIGEVAHALVRTDAGGGERL